MATTFVDDGRAGGSTDSGSTTSTTSTTSTSTSLTSSSTQSVETIERDHTRNIPESNPDPAPSETNQSSAPTTTDQTDSTPDTSSESSSTSTIEESTKENRPTSDPDLTPAETNQSSAPTTATASETTTQSSDSESMTTQTIEPQPGRDNKLAAVIDEQTETRGNVDEQLHGGTTTADIIGDTATNPEVAQHLATKQNEADARSRRPVNTIATPQTSQEPDPTGDDPGGMGFEDPRVLLGLGLAALIAFS